jgi:hypothetical protein
MMHNVCPEIFFEQDTGVFESECKFNYQASRDSIVFSFDSVDKEECFCRSAYLFKYEISTEAGLQKLEMFSIADIPVRKWFGTNERTLHLPSDNSSSAGCVTPTCIA